MKKFYRTILQISSVVFYLSMPILSDAQSQNLLQPILCAPYDPDYQPFQWPCLCNCATNPPGGLVSCANGNECARFCPTLANSTYVNCPAITSASLESSKEKNMKTETEDRPSSHKIPLSEEKAPPTGPHSISEKSPTTKRPS